MLMLAKKKHKLETAYGRDNTKQEGMPYFHGGLSRKEKIH